MTRPYRLITANLDEKWDSFIRNSPDGTIFSDSKYLNSINNKICALYCLNGNEIRAAVLLLESNDGSSIVTNDLVIYSGIINAPSTFGKNYSQVNSEKLELQTFVASELASRYKDIEFALAPTIFDLRGFQWHGYGQKNQMYGVHVKYTSFKNISNFREHDELSPELLSEVTGSRRQQIKYAIRDKIVTYDFEDVQMFLNFYKKTMNRQGENVGLEKMAAMENVLEGTIRHGLIKMYASRLHGGETASLAAFIFDQKRAYYLFGASDPEFRNTPAGTSILWDSFYRLSKLGIKEVDMEGVNSPKRGWFKLGFGGSLTPYYLVTRFV